MQRKYEVHCGGTESEFPLFFFLEFFNIFSVFRILGNIVFGIYYIKNQQDVTLAVLFISNCKITLHVSDAFCFHHQEYWKL